MSKAQKWVLAAGLLLMATAALFPPKYHIGKHSAPAREFLYGGYFDRPDSINWMKLAVEWMFLAALTGAGMVMANGIGGVIKRSVEEGIKAIDLESPVEIKPVDEEPDGEDGGNPGSN